MERILGRHLCDCGIHLSATVFKANHTLYNFAFSYLTIPSPVVLWCSCVYYCDWQYSVLSHFAFSEEKQTCSGVPTEVYDSCKVEVVLSVRYQQLCKKAEKGLPDTIVQTHRRELASHVVCIVYRVN